MARTTFTGPLASGDRIDGAQANVGLAVLSQSAVITFDNTLVQNASLFLPNGSRVLDVIVDTLTAFNSATSAVLSVGTASGGTQYASGVDVRTAAGRQRPTFTAAQLTAMGSTGANNAVVATVTSVGQPSAGQVRVTVNYVQTTANDA